MPVQGSKVLVANLGSTSFKFRLFDMQDERQLARGAIDRIGSDLSRCVIDVENTVENVEADERRHESTATVSTTIASTATDSVAADSVTTIADHGVALQICLDALTNHGCLNDTNDIVAIGFKAVHGGRYSGVQRVTADVLSAMEEMNEVAPAHNPPYIRAMRKLSEQFPDIPLVAAFETGFHATIPERLRTYAIPKRWSQEYHVRRWGFHGASHRYIAGRTAELLGKKRLHGERLKGEQPGNRDLRIVSCHLGGSSSLCAIRNGESVATSMGMSPQTGLPQNNRVGDFDPFALPLLMDKTGFDLRELLEKLASESGLLGVSGVGSDLRDIEDAATKGNADAQLALDLYTTEIRRHLGGMLVELGGADVLVFTGGIGENSAPIRQAVCVGLQDLGIEIDDTRNQQVSGECILSTTNSCTQVWVIPTNEEIVVARQTIELLQG